MPSFLYLIGFVCLIVAIGISMSIIKTPSQTFCPSNMSSYLIAEYKVRDCGSFSDNLD